MQRGGMERARIVVARRARHAGIAVAEELLSVDAEDLARARSSSVRTSPRRGRATAASMLWMSPSSPRVAVSSTTRMTVVMGAQDDAARRDALIVGMRVDEKQRGHAEPLLRGV